MRASQQSQKDLVWQRESEFHDALAGQVDATARPPARPNLWESIVLREAGDLRGRNVVELGCGIGDMTLHFIAEGAAVTALDLSPRMVEVARRRAEAWAPGAHAGSCSVPLEA